MTSQPIPPYDPVENVDNFYAVMTIQLGELIESGLFDWSSDVLNWQDAAYSDEQYTRVCEYFNQRFYYREISMIPYLEWATYLRRKIVFELMPKYAPLYARVEEGINPLSNENEYYKNRTIDSAYPETLLSGNADYITEGKDEEFERIKEGNFADAYENYINRFKPVDEALLDELECMFTSMYSLNMNTSW